MTVHTYDSHTSRLLHDNEVVTVLSKSLVLVQPILTLKWHQSTVVDCFLEASIVILLHSSVKEWHFYLLFDCVVQLLAEISFFESHVPSRIFETLALNDMGWKKNNIPF
ncbi:hypothetical protein POM88_032816 [Heracleum sosnowskyi]|uniref:Uncharacterized protein n=1 Tax=Heracleum sosnowskyi TaxID=360622 RepID=A0AAD8MLN3_9APIA|nr:hypothetical protein POM88_032816 [Heracleum sosnowskyi]